MRWTCHNCTFVNSAQNAFCEACYFSKENDVIVIDDDCSHVQTKRPRRTLHRAGKHQRTSSSNQAVVIDLVGDDEDSHTIQVAKTCAKFLTPAKSLRQIRREQQEQKCNDLALARALQQAFEEEEAATAAAIPVEETYDVLAEQRSNIRETLKSAASGLKISRIEENPHAKVGEKLYNHFVEAWQRVQDQTVVIAFHGTPEANIESICQNGFDSKRRAGQAMGPDEYFAKTAATSVPYCRGGKKMLVVAVLTDKEGLTVDNGNVVVVHKTDHQLPLFVVSFDAPSEF